MFWPRRFEDRTTARVSLSSSIKCLTTLPSPTAMGSTRLVDLFPLLRNDQLTFLWLPTISPTLLQLPTTLPTRMPRHPPKGFRPYSLTRCCRPAHLHCTRLTPVLVSLHRSQRWGKGKPLADLTRHPNQHMPKRGESDAIPTTCCAFVCI